MLGTIALASVLLVVAQVHLAQERLQSVADVAAATFEVSLGTEGAEQHARSVALANNADSLSIENDDAGNPIAIVVRKRVTQLGSLLPAQNLIARSRIIYPNFFRGGVLAAASIGGRGHGDYSGPLVRVDASVICPKVGVAYVAMQRAAALGGVRLFAISGFRTYSEQAVLYAQLGPGIAAPPGTSLHEQATEFDLRVNGESSSEYRWLSAHASAFGFLRRYPWEPWHWGNVRGC